MYDKPCRMDEVAGNLSETVFRRSPEKSRVPAYNPFYKSMTTHADHTVWQDVYRPNTQAGDVYLKLTVIDDVLIVSFKEL